MTLPQQFILSLFLGAILLTYGKDLVRVEPAKINCSKIISHSMKILKDLDPKPERLQEICEAASQVERDCMLKASHASTLLSCYKTQENIAVWSQAVRNSALESSDSSDD